MAQERGASRGKGHATPSRINLVMGRPTRIETRRSRSKEDCKRDSSRRQPGPAVLRCRHSEPSGYWSRSVAKRLSPAKLSRDRVLSWARIAAPLSQHSTPSWQKRHKAHRRRSMPGSLAHVGTTVAITPAPKISRRGAMRYSVRRWSDYSSAKNKCRLSMEIGRKDDRRGLRTCARSTMCGSVRSSAVCQHSK
jgi:hypothetical protein